MNPYIPTWLRVLNAAAVVSVGYFVFLGIRSQKVSGTIVVPKGYKLSIEKDGRTNKAKRKVKSAA